MGWPSPEYERRTGVRRVGQTTVQEIHKILLDILLKEHKRPELAKDNDLVDSIRGYLIENYV